MSKSFFKKVLKRVKKKEISLYLVHNLIGQNFYQTSSGTRVMCKSANSYS